MVLGDWLLHSPTASLFYSSFIGISLAASLFYDFACSPFIGIFHENGSTGWSAILVLIQHSGAPSYDPFEWTTDMHPLDSH